MIFYEKNIRGMMFSKRELNGSAAEEASRTYMVGMQKGETFRQKDWKMYHILNLVLCDKAYRGFQFIRAKDRKDAVDIIVYLDVLFYLEYR